MHKEQLFFAGVGVIVGVALTFVVSTAAEATRYSQQSSCSAKDGSSGCGMMSSGMMSAGMNHGNMTMSGAMQGMMMSLNGKKGADLDQAFLKEMIVHHKGALEMSQAVIDRGDRAELKEFARSIIDAQTKEIDQMQAWQKAWFDQ